MLKEYCEIEINRDSFKFEVEGNFSWGSNKQYFVKENF